MCGLFLTSSKMLTEQLSHKIIFSCFDNFYCCFQIFCYFWLFDGANLQQWSSASISKGLQFLSAPNSSHRSRLPPSSLRCRLFWQFNSNKWRFRNLMPGHNVVARFCHQYSKHDRQDRLLGTGKDRHRLEAKKSNILFQVQYMSLS
jgi:hypothetical protein